MFFSSSFFTSFQSQPQQSKCVNEPTSPCDGVG